MRRHLESRQQGLAGLSQWKLFQIQFRGLAEIVNGVGHGLALCRGACLGVEGDKTALLGWNQNGGEKHGGNLGESCVESTRGATRWTTDVGGALILARP